jgi:O-antigen ligase
VSAIEAMMLKRQPEVRNRTAMPPETAEPMPSRPAGSWGARSALRVLQTGAVAVVFAASTYTLFDLDRFLVPKELVLHVTALLAALCAVRAIRSTRTDRLLFAFLALSAVAALFATNHWLALRALTLSASGIAIFVAARAVRDAGLARPLLNALALAVVLACATSLLQTYGVDVDLFASTRAPGGTLGNRNFVAHAAAFGFPLVLLAAIRARRWFLAPFGVSLVAATLVLTRSRAAWLAFGAMAVAFLVTMLVSPALRRDGATWRRLAAIALFAGAGIAAALLIPNALRWRSDNPYLESVKDVANYQEGSGRGRLIQYERSLLLALHHPLFGVGPGNWPATYAERAARNDPSLDPSEPGITANPWPSSDWIGFIAERGIVCASLLALAFLSITAGAWRQLGAAAGAEDALLAAAMLGTVAAAVVAGAFDAVLLLGLPALLVWAALGALTAVDPEPAKMPRLAVPALLLLSAIGVARSAGQLVAIGIFSSGSSRAALERASVIDPGNYRLHLRLARSGKKQQRCAHAAAAHALFPHATAAREAMQGCR